MVTWGFIDKEQGVGQWEIVKETSGVQQEENSCLRQSRVNRHHLGDGGGCGTRSDMESDEVLGVGWGFWLS